MPTCIRNFIPYPGINYGRCIRYFSTRHLDPTKVWEYKAVSQKIKVKLKKTKRKEEGNLPISLYKK